MTILFSTVHTARNLHCC